MPDEEIDPQGSPGEGENTNLKLLWEKAKRTDESETALAQAQREIAILKSGIDAESPLGKMFFRAYDGDINDVAALKAAAEEIGVPFRGQTEQSGDKGQQESQPAPEPTGTDERQTLAGGAPPDTGQVPDPNMVALEQFQKDISAGMTDEAARGKFLNFLANAAQDGDPRVLVRDTTSA